MAERSFAKEVQALRLGEGEEFAGEAILAVAKALLQSGVAYVGGYQGAPVSHLMDVLADAADILAELGVRFETSASEATAAAMLAASVNYPLRGAVTWKSTVGTNVASDALSNLASAGVQGGALIVIGEDYGEGASIMQERSHAFAMKSQIWLLDPRPQLPAIVSMVERGFELSEASNTPVMLMLRIRACHMHGHFRTRRNRPPPFTLEDALRRPMRDQERIILPPATYLQERRKVEERWPAAVNFIREAKLNEVLEGETNGLGIVVQGGLCNTLLRALAELGLADFHGASRIPILVLNATYPLVPEEVQSFAEGKKALLIVEEGQPEFIEQAVHQLLGRAGGDTVVSGKGHLPMAGEYTGAVVKTGVLSFVREWRGATNVRVAPHEDPTPKAHHRSLADANASAMSSDERAEDSARPAEVDADLPAAGGAASEQLAATPLSRSKSGLGAVGKAPRRPFAAPPAAGVAQVAGGDSDTALSIGASELDIAGVAQAAEEDSDGKRISVRDLGLGKPLPPRPSGLCTGCPERPLFAAMKLVQEELGPLHVSADIGCHSFATMPPFHLGASIMGYGLGAAGGAALNVGAGKRPVALMGDGGFWHNGLTSGIANAVFNRHDGVTLIVDNGYSAATGGQYIPSSRSGMGHQQPNNSIEQAVRGVGVDWVRKVSTYDMEGAMQAFREALTTDCAGPKVIVAEGECQLNKERRTRPLRRQLLASGKRLVSQRFGVDAELCNGDHACIRLSGCPSLTLKSNPDPLRSRPVAAVDNSCVGCGVCGSVAHAATLCPSFHRIDLVTHPSLWERLLARMRAMAIGWLSHCHAQPSQPKNALTNA